MNPKTIVQGFAAAILLLLLPAWPLLSSRHSLIYHSFLPVQSLVWGILIDLAAVTVLAALLFRYLQKSETGRRNVVWVLVGAELAPAFAGDLTAVWQKSLPHLYAELLFYGIVLAGLTLRWLRPAAYQRAVRGGQLLLLMVGCGLAWTVPQLLYLGLRAQPHDAKVPVAQAIRPAAGKAVPGSRGRIVWILFDELSYDQTFEHRFPGLAMPAFDKLKNESFSFSDLKPAGYDTDQVVPSFFLGHVIENLRSNLNGEPSVKLAGQKGWQAFNPHATLFSDAQRLGWTTGIVGWYNPYCRILAGTFDYCFWRVGNGQWNGTAADESTLKNAMAPFMEMLRGYYREPGHPQEDKHAADLAALIPRAETLIRDQNIGFVFIHLGLPHPPGIYDRRPGHRRPTGTYIDNLALADRTLAELMGTVNATPLANKTTVIVCSDHSWRIALWRPTPQWSKEEETASHGIFDPRPVLLIHFPEQSDEHNLPWPFDEIRLHDIIEQLLQGQEPDLSKSLLAGSAGLPATAKP